MFVFACDVPFGVVPEVELDENAEFIRVCEEEKEHVHGAHFEVRQSR